MAPEQDNSHSTAQSTGKEPEVDARQLIKLAVEIGPLFVFFVSLWLGGIFWATGALMVATVISLIVSRMLFHRIAVMPLLSGALVLLFGGLTLWLENDHFIKLKPTILYSMFALTLFGGLAFGKSLLRFALGEAIRLSDEGWRLLTIRWAWFFVLGAVLNEIVWRNFSDQFWAGFKLFGMLPLLLAFAIAQDGLIRRHSIVVKKEGAQ